MKATGIVRRIDDLGRVVIPKEIRRTMRICDGDPFPIFLEQGVCPNLLKQGGDLFPKQERRCFFSYRRDFYG